MLSPPDMSSQTETAFRDTKEVVPTVPCREGSEQGASQTRSPGAGDRLEFHGGVLIPKHVRSLSGVVPELG